MLAEAQRCAVCGWRGEADVCERCGSVLAVGRAVCRRCGKLFEGPIARCDKCGGTVDAPPEPEKPEMIERLAHLPGVDAATARRLYARGFRDPADVLKLALPERAVRLGLHRTLARRLTLQELPAPPKVRKVRDCPVCGTPRPVAEDRCPACDAPWEREPDADDVRRRLEEVAGEVYDLASDPDFQGLPESLREEFLETFEDAGLSTSVDSEVQEQLKEWHRRGLETQELERILREQGSEAFKEQFVHIIRAQVLKARRGTHFSCPLCDEPLAAMAEECGNCGAKFR